MKIGLISDTHGYLDPAVLQYFAGVDEIWHAGDIGTGVVADTLAALKPFRAVFGNIDDRETRLRFPEFQRLEAGGLKILITHIAGTPPRYHPAVRRELDRSPADLLICGHSHILKVMPDPQRPGLLYVNPGAAGQQGFHRIRTLILMELSDGRVQDMKAVELGLRGR
jgi:uncharacterized protein